MSNLGWYQKITSVSKKVGGPKRLLAMVFGTGALAGVGIEKLSKKASNTNNIKEDNKAIVDCNIIYTVETDGVSNEGLRFKKGDTFRVLEVHGNAALIEIIGDNNSPYFVSTTFLSSISNYNN